MNRLQPAAPMSSSRLVAEGAPTPNAPEIPIAPFSRSSTWKSPTADRGASSRLQPGADGESALAEARRGPDWRSPNISGPVTTGAARRPDDLSRLLWSEGREEAPSAEALGGQSWRRSNPMRGHSDGRPHARRRTVLQLL